MKIFFTSLLSLFFISVSAQWIKKYQANLGQQSFYATGKVVCPDSMHIRTIGWERYFDGWNFTYVTGNLKIQYSNDGGNTIQYSKPVNNLPERLLADIFSINKDTTFVITGKTINGFPIGPRCAIYKSTLGVDSFMKVSTDNMFLDNGGANFIHFFDNQNGCVIGDPNYDTTNMVLGKFFEIYTTENCGATWNRIPLTNIPSPLNGEIPMGGIVANKHAAIGNTIWFATNFLRVFKSTDKGKNWTVYDVIPSKHTELPPSCIAFKDSLNGLIGYDNRLFRTSNGGVNWEECYNAYTSKYSPKFFPGNLQYVPGSNGLYLGTNDKFESKYGKSGSGTTFYSYDGTDWKLLATTNNVSQTNDKISLSAIYFSSPQQGWIGGLDGSLYKWGSKKLPPNFNMQQPAEGKNLLFGKTYPIQFTSTDSASARIEMSTNDGVTWDTLSLGITPASSILWKAPKIPATCTWKIVTLDDTGYYTLSKPYIVERPKMIISGPLKGQVLSSANYPISWSSSNVDSVNIYYTIDSGTTWIPIVLNTLSNSSYSWNTPLVAATTCAIRVTAMYDTTYYIQSQLFSIKNTTGIYETTKPQVTLYPNPTRGNVNIESSAPITNIVLFDLLGKQLLKSNTSEIDCSSLKQGLYILKVESEQAEVLLKLVKEN